MQDRAAYNQSKWSNPSLGPHTRQELCSIGLPFLLEVSWNQLKLLYLSDLFIIWSLYFCLTLPRPVPSPGKGGGLRQVADSQRKTLSDLLKHESKSNYKLKGQDVPVKRHVAPAFRCFKKQARGIVPTSGCFEKQARGVAPTIGCFENGQGASHRRPGVMINEQRFLHYRQVRIKKLVHDSKLRLAIWNIGTLTDKGMEIVDTMIRRKVNII